MVFFLLGGGGWLGCTFLGHFFPEEFSFSKAQIWDTAGQDVVGGMGAVIHRENNCAYRGVDNNNGSTASIFLRFLKEKCEKGMPKKSWRQPGEK